MSRLRWALVSIAALAVAAVTVAGAAGGKKGDENAKKLDKIQHIVVVYEENHSFDNLYGGWEGVNGRDNADAARTNQIGQNGLLYSCLLQNDMNLSSPPQPSDCTDTSTGTPFSSHFPSAPFSIEAYIPKTAKTCPPPGAFSPTGFKDGTGDPGGCTRDIVHRFYQEQYQLHGGKQDLYVTGSDAVGLAMGYYDTTKLPIYTYLHSHGHPHYVIADDFFAGAFGGSFLNHQWLIAAAAPAWAGMPAGQHAMVDSNGMPNNYSLYHATGPVNDSVPGTIACPAPITRPNLACGDFAVNTIQPAYQPTSSNTTKLSPQTGTTIGDELSAAHVSWAWYSGGWSNADGDKGAPGWTNGTGTTCTDPNSFPNPAFPYCPNKVFQFHHQPFNYFAAYAPGTPGRAHLQDEVAFKNLVAASDKQCKLDSVSFIKPIGLENEHPGYTNVDRGSDHLVQLLQSIQDSKCANDTMVVVTYDEFGGQWDHVSPPGQGGAPGPHDKWGPGTRIPALVIAPETEGAFAVDDTQYDTTSIIATIEHRWNLKALASRDALVNDLSGVFSAKETKEDK